MIFEIPALPLAAPTSLATTAFDVLGRFAAQPAKERSDPTGALIALGVIAAMGVVGFLLFRRIQQARQESFREPGEPRRPERDKPAKKTPRYEDIEDLDDETRAAARTLRKAAKGAIKVGADGKVERLRLDESLTTAPPKRPDHGHKGATEPARQPAKGQQRQPEVTRAPVPVAGSAPVRDEALREGLSRTRKDGFVARLGKLFSGKQLDDDLMEQVEAVLYGADLGVKATERLLGGLREGLSRRELGDETRVWTTLREQARATLESAGSAAIADRPATGPLVLMIIGVNGTGKTTTIGKLAHRFVGDGHKVLVAAADTFRAAAVDQLAVWCERAGADLHRGKSEADPASVAFDAIKRAHTEGHDLVIVDTAGRLHTNTNLVEELKKVGRVITKAQPDAPHEVLLVLDATMGQNAVQQATIFKGAMGVTGIVLTKLDGTARGGVVLSVADTLGVPVKLIGFGEKMMDLKPFDANSFVEELFATDDEAAQA